VLVVGIRSLGKTFQESVRFSHDVQGGFGGVQPFVQTGVFLCEPGDLSLLSGQLADLRAGFLPTSTPASRCLRHSLINDEYKPSRRRYLPPSCCSHAASQASRWASFSDGVNARRRRGPSLRGCWEAIGSLSPSTSEDMLVRVISVDPYLALHQAAVNQWTQLTLTARATPPNEVPPAMTPQRYAERGHEQINPPLHGENLRISDSFSLAVMRRVAGAGQADDKAELV
jgi:hypothetical protein